MSKILSATPIRAIAPMPTQDPFLFLVHHLDNYPSANEGTRQGNGNDFNAAFPYRMYHGEETPGFPKHPHCGFETVTCTLEGLIDHTDSLGCGGRYGHGDVQFMTAGKGIVHGEMFPLVNKEKPNRCEFFQIWLNLPKIKKNVDPNQRMHWNESIPTVSKNGSITKVWAGTFDGVTALEPTIDSWAHDPRNNVMILYSILEPNGRLVLEKCPAGANRSIYFLDEDIMMNESMIKGHQMIKFNELVELHNPDTSKRSVLVLQGNPINEEVVQHGPFVGNTQSDIKKAFETYRISQFGGWPWEKDEMVFPMDKGRFLNVNGVIQHPPS